MNTEDYLNLCLTLCYFVLVFFSPFSIAIISLGEERANLSAFRTFVRFGVWEGLRFVIVALSGLFSYLFWQCLRVHVCVHVCVPVCVYVFLARLFTIDLKYTCTKISLKLLATWLSLTNGINPRVSWTIHLFTIWNPQLLSPILLSNWFFGRLFIHLPKVAKEFELYCCHPRDYHLPIKLIHANSVGYLQ